MSALLNNSQMLNTTPSQGANQGGKKNEVIIRQKWTTRYDRSLSARLLDRFKEKTASLSKLFINYLDSRLGGYSRWKHLGDNIIEVEGLKQSDLHNFILKAEQMGKKIEYTRTLSVRISD